MKKPAVLSVLRAFPAAILGVLVAALPAAATTFTFELGNSTGGSRSYLDVELAVTVDPGTGGLIDRTFFASDITRLEYSWRTSLTSANRSSYGLGVGDVLRTDLRFGPQSFITTDGSGRGTLGLSTTGPYSRVYFQETYRFQPNTFPWVEVGQGGNHAGDYLLFQWRFGSTTYMQINPSTDVSFLSRESYPSTTVGAVPLPAPVLALLSGLGALWMAGRGRAPA